ncbi:MAG: hypothetical protein K6G88_05460 [Lachnospiraceae bacterium]|nr:hypothetical protein [Lachnospiraceae bacterium]
MNEVFAEQIIKSKPSSKEIGGRIAVVVLFVASLLGLPLLANAHLGILGFTMIFLSGYLIYYIFKITDIEFEYSVANYDLYVEKIMGQIKRKRCKVFDLKKAVVIAPEKSEKVASYLNVEKMYDYSSRRKDAEKMVAVFNSDRGTEVVFFEPNEKIAKAIKSLRPTVYNE